MYKITDINSRRPHITGDAMCLNCKHRWVAVSPIGCVNLECPSCESMKGIYSYHTDCEGDRLECKCGNQYFVVRPHDIFCIVCGITQDFPDMS